MEKTCSKCGQRKPITEFYAMKGMRDGHRNDCKACNLAAKKARYDADPAKAIQRVRRWQQANADRVNEVHRRNNARPERKAANRTGYLRRTYGITQAEYDAMLEAQGGGCAICGRPPRPDISLHVDHDHKTGEIRGLTCFPCNNSLGLMQEEPERFAKAADYLDQHDSEVQRLAEITRTRVYALVGR